ncbi:tyrosine-type recombinase/integrase [Variovorax sp. RB2P76]|uniref:tyrosine-type recombinase/integrase n=1 Tax=Variovorax sp. RB2P76 TaxID=3443736 RepID=UPI003F48FE47
MRIYDKYSEREAVLKTGDPVWILPCAGKTITLRFASDAAQRDLQQKLVVLTQSTNAPSTVVSAGDQLTANWEMFLELLAAGPEQIKRRWKVCITNMHSAAVGKAILKLACATSTGPWKPRHVPLIQGLDTHGDAPGIAQIRRVRRREKLVPIDVQGALVKVLDELSGSPSFSESQAEGLTALALMYQHGVRPVQVLALRHEHLTWVRDATDDLVCLVSFHAAKQKNGDEFEIVRQVKPEWTGPLKMLRSYAIEKGRGRLFSITTADEVWTRVKRVCWDHLGLAIQFTAGALRHTSAQSLADAGHDRLSIKKFLGHASPTAASRYLRASRQQGELINRAIGASKLYGRILSLAHREFVSVDQMLQASEEQQIGAVVGDKLIAGIGLCRSGQPNCPYNPVTSCYGCRKFIPSLSRNAHEEAVVGMRTQIQIYLKHDPAQTSPASLQLMTALSGAQQALSSIDGQEESPR